MTVRNALILVLTAAGVAGALAYRSAHSDDTPDAPAAAATTPDTPAAVAVPPDAPTPVAATPAPAPRPVPRFLELGSDRCTSCKAMIPVLAELRAAHPGALQVDYIDVWKHPDEAERHGVTVIPTQILFAPDGHELFRHQGFFPADAIRARFDALGFPLPTPAEG